MFWVVLLALLLNQGYVNAFRPIINAPGSISSLKMLDFHSLISTLPIADAITEEEVLAVSGQVNELPSPLFAVGFAAVIFLGVAALQFSLGDLNKQEGQARVRDFLQTRRDTERKRGYFD